MKEYLTFGGLPRVCIESDVRKKMEYLKSLFRKTYLTDIKERYHIAYRLPSPEKRDQEMASLLRIDDSFMKMIVTEDAVMKHQDENGIYWVDIYDFLALNEDEL